MTDVLVVGAGPAGLMAADVLSELGHSVLVADAMPSVGRKFLMAGKSGLNLTKDQPSEAFQEAFDPSDPIRPAIDAFGPAAVTAWARSLGQDVFTGSSGRVFPKAMKASPLLRAWLLRLQSNGVTFRTKWRWTGGIAFDTAQGLQSVDAKCTVLALGGASWQRLGANGQWTATLDAMGAETMPFRPSNMGFDVAWSDHMAPHFGKPVKPVGLTVAGKTLKGEFVVSRTGVEGSGVYAVSAALARGGPLILDLMPDLSQAAVVKKLQRPKGKTSLSNYLRKTLGLSAVKIALLNEFARPFPADLTQLPIKSLQMPILGPRPLDEAISTAGGLAWDSLDSDLRLKATPHPTFCAGEMLDWDAPTGGYLITGCLATGRWAGLAAARLLAT
ncbi:TIGR03862 family flavoprotein [Algirhabdus cladophorae]|uniref:TIGR03862 family flavoprotein n=1 Tax=Algirhabdus cladophorae TaxID=3377108 RepID=UPI003B848819